jgi:hypothetical protein
VARRLAIAAIIAISLGAPIAEMFDRWDSTIQNGNDTEANVLIAVLCIGVAFAIGTVIAVDRIRQFAGASARRDRGSYPRPRETVGVFTPVPASSPPVLLRV